MRPAWPGRGAPRPGPCRADARTPRAARPGGVATVGTGVTRTGRARRGRPRGWRAAPRPELELEPAAAHVARARLAQASDHGGPLVLRGPSSPSARSVAWMAASSRRPAAYRSPTVEKPTREAVARIRRAPDDPQNREGNGDARPRSAAADSGRSSNGCKDHGTCAGPPRGNRNAWMHGQRTAEALARRRCAGGRRPRPGSTRDTSGDAPTKSMPSDCDYRAVAPRSRCPRRSRWNCGAGTGQGGSPRPAAPASGVHVRPPVVAGRTIACPCLVGPLSKRPARRPRRPPAGTVPTSRVPDARPR